MDWNSEAERTKAWGMRGRPVRSAGEEQQRRDEEDDPATAWRGGRPLRSWHADGFGGGGPLPRRGSGILMSLALRLLGLAPVRLIVIDVVVRSNGDDELAMGADVACGGGGGLAAGGVGTSHRFYTLQTSCLTSKVARANSAGS